MKIFLAGVFPEGLYRATVDPAYIYRKPWKKFKKVPYLESYYEIRKHDRLVDCIRKRGDKIFLDSGAYSAFTQGVKIDLRDYAYFIKENKDIIYVSSNFDVIGRGMEKESYENLRELESYGAVVQPVHHARDDDKWLQRYIDRGYNYIFLGGMVPESTPYLRNWLDRMWGRYLTKIDGTPRVKVHGFGLTVEELMKTYPWFSVDSTSWKLYAIMGFIVVPTRKRGLQSLAISAKHPARRQRGRHYLHYSTKEKQYLENVFQRYGFTWKKLHEDRASRSVFNSLVYRDFMKSGQFATRFKLRQPRLF